MLTVVYLIFIYWTLTVCQVPNIGPVENSNEHMNIAAFMDLEL